MLNVWDNRALSKRRDAVNKKLDEFEIDVVAPRHGFEPRFTAPKAAVLPLDDRGSLGGKYSTSVAFARRIQATR